MARLGASTSIDRALRERRSRAAAFIRYPVASTAARTRDRVCSPTTFGFDSARLTVAVETPAAAATSAMRALALIALPNKLLTDKCQDLHCKTSLVVIDYIKPSRELPQSGLKRPREEP